MKMPPFFFMILLLFSCASKSQETKKQLSMRDLKFPMIDEGNGRNTFPNPNKDNLIRNHIRAKATVIEVHEKETYPKEIRQRFRKAPRDKKEMGFAKWLLASSGVEDSSFYDTAGNLTKYKPNCFMCGTREFKYDETGMQIYHNSGSDAIIDYNFHYRYDPGSRTLYYADTGIKLSSELNVYRYHFDTSGYLLSAQDTEKGISYRDTFEYDQNRKIKTARHSIVVSKGSGYEYNVPPLPSLVTSTYYYHSDQLDSIISFSENKEISAWNQYRRTYFDSTGLPTKTVYDKVFDRPEYAKTLLYFYSKN